MSKNPKIDINGSIAEAIGEAFKHILGTAFVLLLFGFLFAPLLAPLVEPAIEEKYKAHSDYDKYILVAKKMRHVKAVLWGIAILGWLAVLGSYLTHPGF